MLAIERIDHLDVDLRAFEWWVVEAANVVEEIATETAVRVDGGALEAEVGVVFGDFFVDCGMMDGDGDRQRKVRAHALFQIEETAVDLVEIGGGDLIVGGGDELDTHIVERERGIAVVGDDDAHRDEAVLDVGQAEEAALVGIVAGVDADGDMFGRMRIEGSVLVRRFYRGGLVTCGHGTACEDADGGDDSESL